MGDAPTRTGNRGRIAKPTIADAMLVVLIETIKNDSEEAAQAAAVTLIRLATVLQVSVEGLVEAARAVAKQEQ